MAKQKVKEKTIEETLWQSCAKLRGRTFRIQARGTRTDFPKIRQRQGTIFGSINKDDLHNLEVVYSESKIKEFYTIVKPIDDCIKNYSNQNQKLTDLKALLLSKLASVESMLNDKLQMMNV